MGRADGLGERKSFSFSPLHYSSFITLATDYQLCFIIHFFKYPNVTGCLELSWGLGAYGGMAGNKTGRALSLEGRTNQSTHTMQLQ